MTARARASASGSLRGVGGARRFRADLLRVARLAAQRLRRPVDLGVTLLSDRAIRALNRRHLGHDRATDVVSFDLSGPGTGRVFALAVGVETARREAAARGHRPYHELMLYVVHGTLHLLGHGDDTARARSRMRAAERRALRALRLPSVFDRPAGRGPREEAT